MDRVRLFVSLEDYYKIKNGAEVAVEAIMEEPMIIRKGISNKFINIVKRIKNYIEKNSEFIVTGISEEASYENRKMLRIDIIPDFHIHIVVNNNYKISNKILDDMLKIIKKEVKI